MISSLIALGAAVDPKDEDGMTPLAYAVACENEKEIALLVRQQGVFFFILCGMTKTGDKDMYSRVCLGSWLVGLGARALCYYFWSHCRKHLRTFPITRNASFDADRCTRAVPLRS